MRSSKLFGATLREVPTETEIRSHQFLLRAGYLRQLAAGVFSYLPLAQRSLAKIERILRQEMNDIGGQEINMPVVHPSQVWEASGRWVTIDETMVRFEDRRGRPMCLAMTHEEVVTELCRSEISSYRQLPLLVYQLQTKFRDEKRARGGLIRVREFIMKDSYSLDTDEAGLRAQYARHYHSYLRIGRRVGLPLLAVQSDVGMMGGANAHEFMYVTPIGEDSLVTCDGCDYASNMEVAQFVKPEPPREDEHAIERVATPGKQTIAEVADFLAVPQDRVAKSVFLMANCGSTRPEQLVMCVVRGDMEVNLAAVRNLTGAADLRPAQEIEIAACGAVPGYASAVGVNHDVVFVLADDLVARTPNMVAGANEEGFHLRNVCAGRDYSADQVANLACAYKGATCACCRGNLQVVRGVEVGNIFQLGTRYSAAMGATYTDSDGRDVPIVMGSYGIGVGRLLGCVAEAYNDDRGLTLPMSVAPFHVNLICLTQNDECRQVSERLYSDLQAAGVETLYDDRGLSPGAAMADADLRGIPLRVVISGRSLKSGGAEFKHRTSNNNEVVPLDHVVQRLRRIVDDELAALDRHADDAPRWEHSD